MNKHTLAPAATDTVRNDSMVNINYEAVKVWTGENPVGDKHLPRPQITVILTDDIGSPERTAVISADAADPKALFEKLPKYKNNDGNVPITYTIREEITDPAWVKAGDNLWYSLDGMGKYEGSITNVTAEDVGKTEKDTTLTGGKATNTYATLQTKTSVKVTKLWKDHQNENGVRPGKLRVGLFAPGETEPVNVTTLTAGSIPNEWSGEFENLPIYDTRGAVIDYASYIIKEAYPTETDTWSDWIEYGKTYTIIKDQKEYKYEYSVVANP